MHSIQGARPEGGDDEQPTPDRITADLLIRARELTGPAHSAAVGGLPEALRLVAGYSAGWWDADGVPTAASGKSVRSALALLCAGAAAAADPDDAMRAAVPAAVAVELVHEFSLLHDDVMDGDRTRRHRPAAWTVFGTASALLTGDALLALAFQVLARKSGDTDATRVLAAAVVELCRGQAADLRFASGRDDPPVGVGDCLAMIEGKTGSLLAAACELGARSAGAPPPTASRYGMFGRELGVAYQLVDDLLGIRGDPGRTGKPVGADLAARKLSMPVVAALRSGTKAGARLADLYGEPDDLTEEQILEAADLVRAAGGTAFAREHARHHTELALRALADASPRPSAAADLRLLADRLIGRDH
ncbi:polyprenyl synthetase family protein [Actinocorallia sp. A-T 12471]|uniref:polyprenyl synthetase family protein n=1 Tax=Actinocorallia sp. A-T 12471 TaxID=3089813 RepID=UPI0029CCC60C|nr:polyprenyl synthetase family protein [Actinocorallia sp. A-T 12471]MDX6740594.1 polyprenyl synthetase family protein [Actinocorallia sp. A-T 12471]